MAFYMEKIDIKSLNLKELKVLLEEMGEKAFRAKQIYQWIHQKHIRQFSEMTNISKKLIAELEEKAYLTCLQQEEVQISQIDGTRKYLFLLEDGNVIESVLMRYKHGNSVCISSQVGCRMGCRFCASTLDGLVRGLTAGEMLDQIYQIGKDIGERISNIVMMGIGEPLDNYDNTIRFLRLVSSPDGLNIGLRHISVSTCGVVDKIDSLALEDMPITLSISLHAYDDETRGAIMPINNRFGVDELLRACQRYFERTSRRISFEYTLIAGKNDTDEGAVALARVLKKYIKSTPHVNLIPLNEVKETRLLTSKNVNSFKNKLLSLGINATVRRTLGSDINAACGQLRREYEI